MGTYNVTATYDGVTSSATEVTVTPGEVASVAISTEGVTNIEAGEKVAFDATASDEFGNLVEDESVTITWQNATADGTFEKTTAGSYDVVATIDEVDSEATTVTVEPAAVETVELEPDVDQTIVAGDDIEFDATAFDEFSNLVEDSNTEFTWTNATGDGVFENTTAGEYNVTATVDGVTSSPTTVTVLALANFTVSIDDYPTTVVEGDSVAVDVTITNVGDLEGTQTVTLSEFDGGEVDSDSLTLDAGDNVSRTLVWETDSSDVGKGTVTVATDNESAVTETIEVETAPTPTIRPSPASFEVTIDGVTDTVTEGELVTVDVTVENGGERRGTQEVTLSNGTGDVVNTTDLSLAGGEQTSLSLQWATTVGDAGEGSLTVESDDDTVTTDTIVVLEKPDPAFFELTDLEMPAAVDTGETFDVSVVVTNTGDSAGEQPIALSIDEIGIEETAMLTLEGGETETITVEEISVGNPGVYTVALSSENTSLSASVTVSDREDESVDSDRLPGFGVGLTLFVLLVVTLVSARRQK
ncbi:CARDB domain-containing protein [Natronoglomus mannanivorans]|uniref:CARDB domain-containing protein n=1 Tax=Natronoglomus mannanivorans TaxID=2979990 RepID=A0AAP3E3Z0_9EURY|nr:hypothetical protein [Halobacteria archaeon AArc-xg1-1]